MPLPTLGSHDEKMRSNVRYLRISAARDDPYLNFSPGILVFFMFDIALRVF